jgi:hypothetical protein
MNPWHGAVLAGGAVTGYMLYQWWQKQQEIDANMNGAAAAGVQPPTQAQQEDPAYWERMARDIVAGMSVNNGAGTSGMGALPPWPGIGPVPPTYLGPVWSTVSPVPRRK